MYENIPDSAPRVTEQTPRTMFWSRMTLAEKQLYAAVLVLDHRIHQCRWCDGSDNLHHEMAEAVVQEVEARYPTLLRDTELRED